MFGNVYAGKKSIEEHLSYIFYRRFCIFAKGVDTKRNKKSAYTIYLYSPLVLFS